MKPQVLHCRQSLPEEGVTNHSLGYPNPSIFSQIHLPAAAASSHSVSSAFDASSDSPLSSSCFVLGPQRWAVRAAIIALTAADGPNQNQQRSKKVAAAPSSNGMFSVHCHPPVSIAVAFPRVYTASNALGPALVTAGGEAWHKRRFAFA